MVKLRNLFQKAPAPNQGQKRHDSGRQPQALDPALARGQLAVDAVTEVVGEAVAQMNARFNQAMHQPPIENRDRLLEAYKWVGGLKPKVQSNPLFSAETVRYRIDRLRTYVGDIDGYDQQKRKVLATLDGFDRDLKKREKKERKQEEKEREKEKKPNKKQLW